MPCPAIYLQSQFWDAVHTRESAQAGYRWEVPRSDFSNPYNTIVEPFILVKISHGRKSNDVPRESANSADLASGRKVSTEITGLPSDEETYFVRSIHRIGFILTTFRKPREDFYTQTRDHNSFYERSIFMGRLQEAANDDYRETVFGTPAPTMYGRTRNQMWWVGRVRDYDEVWGEVDGTLDGIVTYANGKIVKHQYVVSPWDEKKDWREALSLLI